MINHNPKISDLFECLDFNNREHELLARFIKNNTETKGYLFTHLEELNHFEKPDELIQTYNNALYYKHEHRKLGDYKEHIYITGYEDDVLSIINELKKLSSEGFKDYSKSVNAWLSNSHHEIDCEEKRVFIEDMFENSKVALIYGAAGTGKSTMINHISNFFY